MKVKNFVQHCFSKKCSHTSVVAHVFEKKIQKKNKRNYHSQALKSNGTKNAKSDLVYKELASKALESRDLRYKDPAYSPKEVNLYSPNFLANVEVDFIQVKIDIERIIDTERKDITEDTKKNGQTEDPYNLELSKGADFLNKTQGSFIQGSSSPLENVKFYNPNNGMEQVKCTARRLFHYDLSSLADSVPEVEKTTSIELFKVQETASPELVKVQVPMDSSALSTVAAEEGSPAEKLSPAAVEASPVTTSVVPLVTEMISFAAVETPKLSEPGKPSEKIGRSPVAQAKLKENTSSGVSSSESRSQSSAQKTKVPGVPSNNPVKISKAAEKNSCCLLL